MSRAFRPFAERDATIKKLRADLTARNAEIEELTEERDYARCLADALKTRVIGAVADALGEAIEHREAAEAARKQN